VDGHGDRGEFDLQETENLVQRVGHPHREGIAVCNIRIGIKRHLNVCTHIGANPLSASSGEPSRRDDPEFVGPHNVVPDLLAPFHEGRAAEDNVVQRIREAT
jgi:hypothetical protein